MRKQPYQSWKRRGFVCNKESFCSNKYIREKYKNSKNNLKKRFFQDFDRPTIHNIAKHEEVDHKKDDNSKSITNALKALMINIRSSSSFLLD